MSTNPQKFKDNGYLVVRNAIPVDTAELLGATFMLAEKAGHLDTDDVQVMGATCAHAYPAMEAIMLQLLPLMEKNTGLTLIPTYSFARVYRKGDTLVRHTDRESCEISATLALTYHCNKLWPIFVEDASGNKSEIALDKGDMMIYRGCERPHWREPFEAEAGNIWIQVFVHYVDANGPFREFALDKRRSLGHFYKSTRVLLMNGERKYDASTSQ
jgi:hypothetical protein